MGRGVARLLWHLIRLPALAILLAIEPFISLLLVGAALIGVSAGVILRCSGDLPDFPFWEMLAFSIAALLLLIAYHMLIAIVSR
ncbi:MAG: hypothetical protein M0Z85_08330 [Gammaproteobacteria bacterium]|nr:hypothetical protein [Gammaproteobacteria bacterium]